MNTSIRLFTDLSHAEEEGLVEVIPSGGRTLHAGIDHDMPATEPPVDWRVAGTQRAHRHDSTA